MGCLGASCPPSFTQTLSSPMCGLYLLVFKLVRGCAPTRDQRPGAMGDTGGLCGVRAPVQIHLCKTLGLPDPSPFPLCDGARPGGFLTGCYFRRLPVGQAPEQEVSMKQASRAHLLCVREPLPVPRNCTSAAVGGI